MQYQIQLIRQHFTSIDAKFRPIPAFVITRPLFSCRSLSPSFYKMRSQTIAEPRVSERIAKVYSTYIASSRERYNPKLSNQLQKSKLYTPTIQPISQSEIKNQQQQNQHIKQVSSAGNASTPLFSPFKQEQRDSQQKQEQQEQPQNKQKFIQQQKLEELHYQKSNQQKKQNMDIEGDKEIGKVIGKSNNSGKSKEIDKSNNNNESNNNQISKSNNNNEITKSDNNNNEISKYFNQQIKKESSNKKQQQQQQQQQQNKEINIQDNNKINKLNIAKINQGKQSPKSGSNRYAEQSNQDEQTERVLSNRDQTPDKSQQNLPDISYEQQSQPQSQLELKLYACDKKQHKKSVKKSKSPKKQHVIHYNQIYLYKPRSSKQNNSKISLTSSKQISPFKQSRQISYILTTPSKRNTRAPLQPEEDDIEIINLAPEFSKLI